MDSYTLGKNVPRTLGSLGQLTLITDSQLLDNGVGKSMVGVGAAAPSTFWGSLGKTQGLFPSPQFLLVPGKSQMGGKYTGFCSPGINFHGSEFYRVGD